MRSTLIGLVLCLLATACAHDAGKGAAANRRVAADYYPLAIGNRWAYEINGRPDKTVDVEILREEDGFFVDNQGGKLRADAFGVGDPKRYLLRDPLEVGGSWKNIVSVSSAERYTITGVGMKCEAPAGNFEDCVQVEVKNRVDATTTLVNRMTFAPGVGLVRTQVVALRSDGKEFPQTELALKSYKLAEAK